ncbi:conserved hypothetical protein [Agrobacterium tumefaciens str. Kerr 14]|uniref:DNA2/NAM7 helicase-like C-terminal domain-containing protein n=1 Tax=Agrobacterium tumefaciens str. Kerr 14 TaxID=1183424 RepID=A0A1S7SAB8_AGRTU|nr:DEAD/DEAH box helicase [Agrobacterium tumefaciens]CUX65452.1 conserved hypothetical protein [Agrobacterium tumefaciens str. Kerr 14]
MTTGKRPYLTYSVDQLEDLFSRSRDDVGVMEMIERELGDHRVTGRARKLREQVQLALAAARTVRAGSGDRRPLKPDIPASAPENIMPSSASTGRSPQRTPPSEVPGVEDLPPPLALGDIQALALPKGQNEPRAILASWSALEALSPQTYRRREDLATGGDQRSVADFSKGGVPWGKGERSKPKYQLYYQIVLGSIAMERATHQLIDSFGKEEELSSPARERAAIGAVLVDKDGFLLEDRSVAISSFAWALPLALRHELGTLGIWPRVEEKLTAKVDEILRRRDGNGQPLPLDMATIDRAYRWVVRQFGLAPDLLEPPSFALRVYHHYKSKSPPEVALLNSFYLNDLSRAAALVDNRSVPVGLKSYLASDRPGPAVDLFEEDGAIEDAVAPRLAPLARWPSPAGHPLVLLQQAAVNLSRKELLETDGIVAVNGPPGTGKTTLLRDIVAATVLDRALAMARFENPQAAFSPSSLKTQTGDAGYLHLYRLDPSLRGHELLVASSNNKAVENISRELPASKAIGRDVTELSYFRTVSDLVYGPRKANDADDRSRLEPIETWGMIAAVLGNAKNRAAFTQSFWWDKDRALRLYLKAAKGDSVLQEIKDEATGEVITRRTPTVVASENPPSPQQARSNWLKARAKLLTLKQEVEKELAGIEAVRSLCVELSEACSQVKSIEAAKADLIVQLGDIDRQAASQQAIVSDHRHQHERNIAAERESRRQRPGLFARLLRQPAWKVWQRANEPLERAVAASKRALDMAEKSLSETAESAKRLAAEIAQAELRLAPITETVRRLESEIEPYRASLGDRIVDGRFFSRGHEASNLEAPWIPDRVHRKREDLFAAAIEVHRAFIDAAAQKVLHNIGALMNVFSAGPPPDADRRELLGDLWSTLFMAVPLVSTTFASVDRMLGLLPPGSIGWLLIDEAGQAPPQAAVGAVMRARRSIVVGDPLQIPPVVSLPGRLIAEICRFFQVDMPVWSAPEASAQTLADRASRYQTSFRSDQGPRHVGMPLLVHRRCQEPMFGISNRIAYDQQMVHAPAPKDEGKIGAVLGPSKWLDIDGQADTKWCAAEGEVVISMLRKLAKSEVTNPDLFIITPFRIVAQEMRRRLRQEKELIERLKIDIEEWTEDRVGTIHTVQGREAHSVIVLLGAPAAAQQGARNWATGTPNILNVAVSRAKQNLYVVGSYAAWSGMGHARELASIRRAPVAHKPF